MTQYNTEPEFLVAEKLPKTDQSQEIGLVIGRDYLQVVADLVELSQRAIELEATSKDIVMLTQLLAQSLREQG